MKTIAVVLENGFEEIEAVTPFDVLIRAGFRCEFVSTKSESVTSSRGIVIKTKKVTSLDSYDMIVLPGGMPGAKNLSENAIVLDAVRSFLQEGKKVAAICAAPALVLTAAGVTAGRKVTCYPGMETNFKDADFSEDCVVTDGNLITSRGPATAMEFAFTLADELGGNSQPVKDGMLYIR